MSEPEVSLRLAIHLISEDLTASDVVVSIDGAHAKTGNTIHFDVKAFLASLGWHLDVHSEKWQGKYGRAANEPSILIHSQSGQGDVVAELKDGRRLLVECKKGPLVRSPSSSEYPLMREALGQVFTLAVVPPNALLAVAVPHGERFVELAVRWREAPLIRQAGIRILTVSQSGAVSGL
jgi:hypothetical protein